MPKRTLSVEPVKPLVSDVPLKLIEDVPGAAWPPKKYPSPPNAGPAFTEFVLGFAAVFGWALAFRDVIGFAKKPTTNDTAKAKVANGSALFLIAFEIVLFIIAYLLFISYCFYVFHKTSINRLALRGGVQNTITRNRCVFCNAGVFL
jgi:hypothetical protein